MEREICLAPCFCAILPWVPESSGKEAEVSQRMRIRPELSPFWTTRIKKNHNNGLIVSSPFSHIIAYKVLQIRNFTINTITSLQPLWSSSLNAGWRMGSSQIGQCCVHVIGLFSVLLYCLITRNHFCAAWVMELWRNLPRGCGVFTLELSKSCPDTRPRQAAPGVPAWGAIYRAR